MLKTRKVRVLFQAAFVGAFMGGLSSLTNQAEPVARAIVWGIGTGIAQAIWETGIIYNRLKREAKPSQFNNG